ncbi:MAG: response regulator transcription factor [Chitinophagaceae bacterium]|nr:MAG: response regulator transcription factor [Chitinophagaceae bacterium]
MNCLIVDDNKMARDALKHLTEQVEDLSLVGECSSAMEAYNLICSKPIDIVFLDIEMPDLSGIELTRQVAGKKPITIFITGQKHYATDAFELNVADYIVKPVTPIRFQQALAKAREIYLSSVAGNQASAKEYVFIRDCGMLKRLIIDEIHFIEAMGDYVKIFTQQAHHSIHISLKKIEEKLPAQKFQRVHRSYVVALNKIERIEEGVIIIHNKPVPVADIYRNALNTRLNIV